MRLIIEPRKNSQTVTVETKLGVMPVADFLKIVQAKDGRNKSMLEADAGIDHATHYKLLNQQTKGHSLRAIMMLLDALGYDIMVVKREQ